MKTSMGLQKQLRARSFLVGQLLLFSDLECVTVANPNLEVLQLLAYRLLEQ